MHSASTHFIPARRMGIYEPINQMSMWAADFKGKSSFDESPPFILDNHSEDTSHGTSVGPSDKYDQDSCKPTKVLRRLAQNREAARKSRLRKKAYVKQLENSKLRLVQLEQELQRARQQQGMYAGGSTDTNQIYRAIATFETEYGNWVEERNRKVSDLGNAMKQDVGDTELQLLVDGGMRHYFELFAMKSSAAKADVFYVMSGLWKTPAERFFLWIGGFRPSEILKVMLPHLDSLSKQQHLDVCNLAQSCQQAEEALSQGMEKLHVILAETIAGRKDNYSPHIRSAVDKLEALVRFVGQADHLRQETLQQLLRILNTRQGARALVDFGEYLNRLRALSSVWSSRARESI